MTRVSPRTGYQKRGVPERVRRGVAAKYGCPPGGTIIVRCAYCPKLGRITWFPRKDGGGSCRVHFEHELDHVIPEVVGGSSEVDNIVLACMPCNRRKGHKV